MRTGSRLLSFALAMLLAASVSASAQSFEVVHRFANGPSQPVGTLLEGADGNFYGVTEQGGDYNAGTVYRVTPSGERTSLHDFRPDDGTGSGPRGGLVLADDGFLYGATGSGGSYDAGTIFRISLAGDFTVVFAGFGNAAFSAPASPGRLLKGADGKLYGTTSYNPGIFRFDPATLTFEELFRFSSLPTGTYWEQPSALIQASDGQFYGVVKRGGSTFQSLGVVFRMTTSGSVSVLHQFVTGGAQISMPSTALIEAPDGYLYGLTSVAGLLGQSALYRIDFTGSFSVQAIFTDVFEEQGADNGPDLMLGPDGYFYAPSQYGVNHPLGAILRIDTSGNLTAIHEFSDNSNTSRSTLALGSDGLLYGVRSAPASGSVYRVSTLGVFEDVNVFKYDTGFYPLGSLVKASDGQLYGTASGGGANDLGTIFRLDAQGLVTVLHSLAPGEGGYPVAGLHQASDGWLYGTTYGDNGAGCGTVFRMSLAGTFETTHEFDCTDGQGPRAPVLQASDGLLYGTTASGGTLGNGTVYRMSTTGVFEPLYSFESGSQPTGALVQANDGLIYGVTEGGGDFGLGTVFRIDLLGQHTLIHSFGDESEFYTDAPRGGLVQASDGWLYGTTARGGDQEGVLYRVSTAGAFEVVSTGFDQGLSPSGELIQGPDGLLYGTTSASLWTDVETAGTIYRVGVGGNVVTVKAFEFTPWLNGSSEAFDGSVPTAGLTIGYDGLFFGTTSNGGSAGSGTIFRIDLASETPTGSNVEVQPVDPVTGTAPVNLTFGAVLEPGTTTVTTSTSTMAPPPPATFNLGSTPTFFDVETTAVFEGVIQVCFNYGGLSLVNPAAARLLHYNGLEWEDVTISNDVPTTTICGNVDSLSPFVIGTDTTTPSYAVNPVFDQEKVYKAGSTIPIRVQITQDGANVSAASLAVVATGLRRKTVDTNWGAPEDPGQSNPDLNFSFTSVNGEPGYRFNLKTAKSYVGTYELKFTVGSDVELVVEFQVR